jgi:hypothetical protein
LEMMKGGQASHPFVHPVTGSRDTATCEAYLFAVKETHCGVGGSHRFRN